MRARLIEIFGPLEGAENAPKLASFILQKRFPELVKEVIDRKIAEHSITGDDLTFLEGVKKSLVIP